MSSDILELKMHCRNLFQVWWLQVCLPMMSHIKVKLEAGKVAQWVKVFAAQAQ